MAVDDRDQLSVTDLVRDCRAKGIGLTVVGKNLKFSNTDGYEELAAEVVRRKDEVMYSLWGEWLDRIVCDTDEYGDLPADFRDRARALWDRLSGDGVIGVDEVLAYCADDQALAEITALWRTFIELEPPIHSEPSETALWEPDWLNTRKVARWVWRITESPWFEELPSELQDEAQQLNWFASLWILDGIAAHEEEMVRFKELYRAVNHHIRFGQAQWDEG
jgi:hypothetical protein